MSEDNPADALDVSSEIAAVRSLGPLSAFLTVRGLVCLTSVLVGVFVHISLSDLAMPQGREAALTSFLTTCLALLSLLSVILVAARASGLRASLLVCKLFVVLLLSIPFRSHIIMMLSLLTSVLLEIALSFSLVPTLIFQVLFSLCFLLFSSLSHLFMASYWHIDASVLSSSVLLRMTVYVGAVNGVAAVVRLQVSHANRLKQANLSLNSAVLNLIRINKETQDYVTTARETARLEERRHLTREIHDSVGYTLTNIIVMMESAVDFLKADLQKAEQLIVRARQQALNGFDEIRKLLKFLRSVDVVDPGGLVAISRLVSTIRVATGIRIAIEYGNLPMSFSNMTDHVIYRSVQEGIINAIRHGHATRIRIMMWIEENVLHVMIADDGAGSKEIKEGIGLSDLRLTVESMGGALSTHNSIAGFELRLVLPLVGRKD